MRGGDRTELVRFQKPVLTPDGAGGFDQDWQDIDNPKWWASVEPYPAKHGSDTLTDSQLRQNKIYHLTGRKRIDVNHKMRIIWGNVTLKIIDCPQPGRTDLWLTLVAEQLSEQDAS